MLIASSTAQKAAGALANLAAGYLNQEAIRQAGAVPQLVALLYAGEASEATQQAAGALRNLAANNSENKEAVREAGGIAPLVALLSAGPDSLCAQKAAGALRNLAANNVPNQDQIRVDGGLPRLVTLLHAGPHSIAAQESAAALANLSAGNPANKEAVRAAGGIAPLCALLQPQGTETAQHARVALHNVLSPSAMMAWMGLPQQPPEGSITPQLLALLASQVSGAGAGAGGGAAGQAAASQAAAEIAEIRAEMRNNAAGGGVPVQPQHFLGLALRDGEGAGGEGLAIPNLATPVVGAHTLTQLEEENLAHQRRFRELVAAAEARLRAGAADAAGSFSLYAAARARRLQAVLDVVELSQDVVELSQALERARSLAVPAEVLEPAVLRLVKLEEERVHTQRRRCEAIAMDACRSEAARARLRTLGLPDEAMRVPLEFLCPITQERMVDPVVASDGHSYEREAISHVLYRSSGLSPLTRERLRHELFPNIALRKAISEYETEAAGLLERFLEAQHQLSSTLPFPPTAAAARPLTTTPAPSWAAQQREPSSPPLLPAGEGQLREGWLQLPASHEAPRVESRVESAVVAAEEAVSEAVAAVAEAVAAVAAAVEERRRGAAEAAVTDTALAEISEVGVEAEIAEIAEEAEIAEITEEAESAEIAEIVEDAEGTEASHSGDVAARAVKRVRR